VFVPGVLACSGHVERGEMVAVSVAVERPDGAGGWCVGVTRGTTLSSQHANSREYFFNITSGYGDVAATCLFLRVWILHPKNETDGFPWRDFAHCISFNLYIPMQDFEVLVLTSKGLQFVAEFEDTSRSGWFIGTGRAMMTRASLFREIKGVAVEMVDRVFDLPSFNGMVLYIQPALFSLSLLVHKVQLSVSGNCNCPARIRMP